jgi:hypothetical protein
MSRIYEPYTCIDLGDVVDAVMDRNEASDAPSHADERLSCRGRLLLLVTSRSVEVVRVPDQLH